MNTHGSAGIPCRNFTLLRLRHAFPGNEHVQRGVLLDVCHGLLVSNHCEVVAIALEDLVMHAQARFDGGAVAGDFSHIDALQERHSSLLFVTEARTV